MKKLFLATAALVMMTGHTLSQELCHPRAEIMASAKAHGATWHKATYDQWQFLRGIFAMDPQTPPGLPYGSSAGWLTLEGDDGALVLFIDRDQACTPMTVPKVMLDMLDAIKSGKIGHEGKAL